MKRLLSVLLSLVMVLTYIPLLAFAEDESSEGESSVELTSGTIGTCDWDVSSDGVLTIQSGTISYDENAEAFYINKVWGNEYFALMFEEPEDREIYDEETDEFLDPPEEVLELPVITKVKSSGKVTLKNAAFLFMGFSSVEEFDLRTFDTSSVTHMNYMFNGCIMANKFDLSSFDTSNVTTMDRMFEGCGALETIDLSSFNTSKVSDMFGLFRDCDSLVSVNLSSFNTSKVTDMSGMFQSCVNLESVDLSSFQIMGDYKCSASAMFQDCESLGMIKCGNWDESCNAEFPVAMENKTTGEKYKAEDLIPTGNGQTFVALGYDPEPDEPDEPDEPGKQPFTTGVDNNSFGHTEYTTHPNAGFKGVKNYQFDSVYKKALKKELPKSSAKVLEEILNNSWGGSCAGISATMALVFNGNIDLSTISDHHSGTYFSMWAPDKDRKLFNNIQYCQTYVNFGSKDQYIARYYPETWEQKIVSGGESKTQLKELVDVVKIAATDNKVLILEVNGNTGGHVIVITGYSYDSNNNRHLIHVYDCNGTLDSRYGGQITDLVVKGDYSGAMITFTFGSEKSTYKTKNWMTGYAWSDTKITSLAVVDPDRVSYYGKNSKKASISKKASSSGTEQAVITIPVGSSLTVTNSAGEYFSIEEPPEEGGLGELSGDMAVYDATFFSSGNSIGYANLYVDESNSFTVDSINGIANNAVIYGEEGSDSDGTVRINDEKADVYIGVYNKDTYGSVKATDVEKILFDENGEISVTPKKQNSSTVPFDFESYVCLNDSADSSLLFTGSSESATDISTNGLSVNVKGDNLQIDSTKCFSNCFNDEAEVIDRADGAVIDAESTIEYLNSIDGYRLQEEQVQLEKSSYVYNGKPHEPEVTIGGLMENINYEVDYENNINAGKATVIIRGLGDYQGVIKKTFTINKAPNLLSASGKTVKIKAKKVKKKAQTIKRAKSITYSKAQGKVTYKLNSVTKSKFKKYFKVNANNGNITVKKKLKKGTYKVKVNVTAAGNGNYLPVTKTVTVKVRVK